MTDKHWTPSPALAGVFRSLRLYHGDAGRAAAMDRLYARYLGPGGLAFDIGAHVGDRVSSFRRLGAQVIGVEPQPRLVRALRLIHSRDPDVTIVAAACTDRAGTVALHLNVPNPTVATVSSAFVVAANGADGWQGQAWSETLDVPATTLDALIDAHGVPQFIKIDVEGAEAAVLRGLTVTVPALSFEITTLQRDAALDALSRARDLGYTRFNIALGESQAFSFPEFVDDKTMARHIRSLPHAANSGDIYCERVI